MYESSWISMRFGGSGLPEVYRNIFAVQTWRDARELAAAGRLRSTARLRSAREIIFYWPTGPGTLKCRAQKTQGTTCILCVSGSLRKMFANYGGGGGQDEKAARV